MIREITISEVEDVSGGNEANCGYAVAAGAAVGARFGIYGAIGFGAMSGAFCLAGRYA